MTVKKRNKGVRHSEHQARLQRVKQRVLSKLATRRELRAPSELVLTEDEETEREDVRDERPSGQAIAADDYRIPRGGKKGTREAESATGANSIPCIGAVSRVERRGRRIPRLRKGGLSADGRARGMDVERRVVDTAGREEKQTALGTSNGGAGGWMRRNVVETAIRQRPL